jgi:hypothetical protein
MYLDGTWVVDGTNHLNFLETDGKFLRCIDSGGFQSKYLFGSYILYFDDRCAIAIANFANNFEMLFEFFILYAGHVLDIVYSHKWNVLFLFV